MQGTKPGPRWPWAQTPALLGPSSQAWWASKQRFLTILIPATGLKAGAGPIPQRTARLRHTGSTSIPRPRMAVQRQAGGPQPRGLGQKMAGQAWDLLTGSHLASKSLTMAAAVRLLYWPSWAPCTCLHPTVHLLSPSTDLTRGLSRSRDCGVDLGSEVYRMLRESAEPTAAEPKQSGSFRYLQGMLEAGEGGERPGPGGPRNLKPTAGKLGAPLSGLQGLPECTRCGHGIVGTIVKARDKLYHPECFMCSDCGLNLKQRGYFFLDDRLYCESHAKARVKPPEGYDVVAVYPNAKVELV
ncbi:PDZ and LIM domain protein 4 isoform X2 [Monodon monoceros]|uniref:PDZ and LIM domain protein 4 isoform X2 n=1 Tax=Monodon monoceros TaxID=40151 RepID=UPI0010F87FA2|nr:PDZ and LIM domain protein 4 isoform X2 [Monodon monoceros]